MRTLITTAVFRLIDRMVGPGKRMRALQFEALAPPVADVVFLGDSITAGGLWHEWFPGVRLVNRGIDGDTSAGVLARIDTAVSEPRAVFLLIGTNDIAQGTAPEKIVADVEAICRAVRRTAPGAQVWLQSIMPRARLSAVGQRTLVELNEAYRVVAERTGAVYLDLWPALDDGRGRLRAGLTLDGLHLTGAGYAAWVEVLGPLVEAASQGSGPGGAGEQPVLPVPEPDPRAGFATAGVRPVPVRSSHPPRP